MWVLIGAQLFFSVDPRDLINADTDLDPDLFIEEIMELWLLCSGRSPLWTNAVLTKRLLHVYYVQKITTEQTNNVVS